MAATPVTVDGTTGCATATALCVEIDCSGMPLTGVSRCTDLAARTAAAAAVNVHAAIESMNKDPVAVKSRR